MTSEMHFMDPQFLVVELMPAQKHYYMQSIDMMRHITTEKVHLKSAKTILVLEGMAHRTSESIISEYMITLNARRHQYLFKEGLNLNFCKLVSLTGHDKVVYTYKLLCMYCLCIVKQMCLVLKRLLTLSPPSLIQSPMFFLPLDLTYKCVQTKYSSTTE